MPTNNLQALLSADIPDPTDFSTNELRQLDSSLRCTICGEFYDAPVTLGCGHCFCSLCIRQHIVKEAECPSCRKPTVETHFRLNPVLEEAVAAWQRSRPIVLRLSRKEQRRVRPEQTPRPSRPSLRADATKRKRYAHSEDSDSDVVFVEGPSKWNPSSEAIESSPIQANDRRPSKRRDTEPSSDIGEEDLGPDSLVSCPICGRQVEYQLINGHMDGPDCNIKAVSVSKPRPPKPEVKDEWSKILGRGSSRKGKGRAGGDSDEAMERLPKVSYAVLKDKAVKDLLLSQKLPTTGDRSVWIPRHQRWVMMNNANLDKSEGNRKSLAELRSELKRWEEERIGPKRIVEDTAAHEAAYHEDFKRLVEQARRSGITRGPGDVGSSSRTPRGQQDNGGQDIVDEEQYSTNEAPPSCVDSD
ncbi:hypothetical protein J3A83DRAFT_4166584 [Scleroderma citrinum]